MIVGAVGPCQQCHAQLAVTRIIDWRKCDVMQSDNARQAGHGADKEAKFVIPPDKGHVQRQLGIERLQDFGEPLNMLDQQTVALAQLRDLIKQLWHLWLSGQLLEQRT